jgi:hypothetical protein
MVNYPRLEKLVFVVGISALIILNMYTFAVAYPETYTPSPGINTSGSILAKDFSAYYIGAWRLWHNSSQVYKFGALQDGEPSIDPYPQAYKYLPSFSLMLSPLLMLDYQQALTVFDVFQLMLLPLMAFLLYSLLEKKGLLVTFAVSVIALLFPSPTPQWGLSTIYYWQWGEGQAKVLITFLLLLSFYFGSRGKPTLSGVALALGFFDPRFGLLSLPLFVMYNRRNLKTASLSAVAALLVSNSMLLYPGLASGFISMIFSSALTTPLYFYSFIPFFTIGFIMIINYRELAEALGIRKSKNFSNKTQSSKTRL